MNKLRILALLAALLCGLSLVSAALAQSSTNYDLIWHVIGSGGSGMGSTTYAVEGTIGQALAGRTESTHYTLAVGYWYPSAQYTVYLPLVFRNGP